jgi:biotin transporter BioY
MTAADGGAGLTVLSQGRGGWRYTFKLIAGYTVFVAHRSVAASADLAALAAVAQKPAELAEAAREVPKELSAEEEMKIFFAVLCFGLGVAFAVGVPSKNMAANIPSHGAYLSDASR